jgi:hypothetical protein
MTNQNPHPESWKLLVLLLKRIAEKKGISHYKIAELENLKKTTRQIRELENLLHPKEN